MIVLKKPISFCGIVKEAERPREGSQWNGGFRYVTKFWRFVTLRPTSAYTCTGRGHYGPQARRNVAISLFIKCYVSSELCYVANNRDLPTPKAYLFWGLRHIIW